jgi:hypothetical protein
VWDAKQRDAALDEMGAVPAWIELESIGWRDRPLVVEGLRGEDGRVDGAGLERDRGTGAKVDETTLTRIFGRLRGDRVRSAPRDDEGGHDQAESSRQRGQAHGALSFVRPGVKYGTAASRV